MEPHKVEMVKLHNVKIMVELIRSWEKKNINLILCNKESRDITYIRN